ncbi:MAG TPA: hypothetical protein VFO19_06665 [Vicinamibacterales bacterium]|nr:hypothetical protein [Vicinamibacterales bacterium]
MRPRVGSEKLVRRPARHVWLALLVAAVALSAVVFALRARGLAASGLYVDPLGHQGPPIYSIWKVQNGHPLYEWPDRHPYSLTLYNALFYHVYARVLAAAGVEGRDIVFGAQRLSAMFAAAGALLTFVCARRLLPAGDNAIAVAGFLSALLMWIGTNPMGWWHLGVRPDMMALAFAVAGLVIYTRGIDRDRPEIWLLVASFCFCVTWMTKQSYVASLTGVCLYTLIVRRSFKHTLWIAIPAATLMAVALLGGGEVYRRNLLWAPSISHLGISGYSGSRLGKVLFANAWIWAGPLLALLAARTREERARLFAGVGPFLCVGIVGFGFGTMAMLREGGEDNAILEGHVSMGIAATVLFARLLTGVTVPLVARAMPMLLVPAILYPAYQLGWKQEPLHVATPETHQRRERLAAFITSLPAPVFINDGMLSQPWFTSQSRYPAYVPDQLWMEIAQRDGWLPPDWIDTLIRDRAFGAFLLPHETRWVEVGRAAGYTAEHIAGRDDGREYLVLRRAADKH